MTFRYMPKNTGMVVSRSPWFVMNKILFSVILAFNLSLPAWSQGYYQGNSTQPSSGGGFFHGLRRLGGALVNGAGGSPSQAQPGQSPWAQGQDISNHIFGNVVAPLAQGLGYTGGGDLSNQFKNRGLPGSPQATQYSVPPTPYNSPYIPVGMGSNQFLPSNSGYQMSMPSYPQMQTYSGNTIGNTTFLNGANGTTTVNRMGNMTFINGPNGTTTGNTVGNMTFYNGPGGTTTSNRIGDYTYFNGPSGNWNSTDIGNTTFIHGPGLQNGTIQRIGPSSFGNFTNY
jgi:hypothetical protein